MTPRSAKSRLDTLLVDRGLVPSREAARRLILSGRVLVRGQVADKAGALIDAGAAILLQGPPRPFASRGGLKLQGALDALGVDVAGRICLDVGASTGGFTDCLLQRGAQKVYAVDVGHGQLEARLRADPRVVLWERTNVRFLEPGDLADRPGLATVDVSFISLRLVLPAVARCLDARADVLALVKPQFEVGRGRVGRGGVVRDPEKHRQVLRDVAGWAAARGLAVRGVVASSILGPKGNREFFLHLATEGPPIDLEASIEAAVSHGPSPARRDLAGG